MSINIGDNFSYLGKKFLDDREHFDTVAKMKACNDVPNGFITYCDETNTRYEYHADNQDDATLGKWRVFKSVPDINFDEYVTQEELEEAIKDVDVTSQLENYATKDDIPTKTSELENDSGYLTEHQDISHLVTQDEFNELELIETSPTEPTDEDVVIWINTSEDTPTDVIARINDGTVASNTVWSSEKVDDTLDKYATKTYVSSEIAKAKLEGEEIDLSGYATKDDIPTKTSELTNDSGFLTSIPNEYVTDDELNDKGYLTEHQNISHLATKDEIPTKVSELENDKGYLTSIPNEYVTDSELTTKGYATTDYVDNAVESVDVTSQLNDYAKKSELHSHSNKSILDGITSDKITSWNNKSTFSGNYNDLTNKPTIPTIPTNISAFTNDKGYLTSIPSEYVTDGELNAKNYVKTVNNQQPDSNGNVTVDVNMQFPTVVDSIDQMTDTSKQYILSSDGCVYAYQTTMTEETIEWVDVFNGFQENKRINSSGQVVAGTVDVTNYIPCKPNDTFRLEGFSIPSTYESGKYYQTIGVSATDGGTLKVNYLCTDIVENNTGLSLVEENGYTVGFTLNESFLGSDFSYMVITSQDITADSKVLKKTIVPPKEITAWENTGLQLATPKPQVVDSIEEMTDVTKKYVLSTDGYVYAYEEGEGGGNTPLFKNLADVTSSDWLTGYRLSTASTSAQDGSYVTNYIPCEFGDIVRVKGMDIRCYSSNTAHKSRFHLYKSDKTMADGDCGYIHYLIDTHGFGSIDGDTTTVIAGHIGNSTTYEVPTTAYIRFCGYLPSGTLDDVIITVNEEIAYGSTKQWISTGKTLDEYIANADVEEQLDKLDTRVTKLEKDIANIGTGGSTENVTVPSYWLSELDNKADIIQQAVESAGRNKSAFYWYTDAHWYTNAKKSPMLLEYMCKNTPINKVNFGGDIVGDPSPYDHANNKTVYEWRKLIANVPNHHSVYGNHDLNHWTTDVHDIAYALVLASEETSDMVVGGDSYYYIDCPSEKTRYLYLSYLTSNQTAMLEQGQFIVDSLMSTPENWHIVVMAHRWWQYSSSKTPTVGSIPTYEKDILSVFDSYNARQNRSGSNYFTARDFTNAKAKVEFCIGGHIHAEYDFRSDGGIPIIITASDTNQERHEGDDDCGTVGTITEQAIYGIIADYKNNKINVIGIGRGETRIITL